MSATYIVRASFGDRFGRTHVQYWDGVQWTPQAWDASHFDDAPGAAVFIEEFCSSARASGWVFDIVTIDFGDV
jgi:hypothetical protein